MNFLIEGFEPSRKQYSGTRLRVMSGIFILLMWIERIEPSTTRNGLKGAVMNVAFLFAIVSIGPTLIPGLCQREPVPVPRPWRKVTTVFFGKGAGPKVCACHIDFKRYAAADVEHYAFSGMPTCESNPDPHNLWMTLKVPDSPVGGGYTYASAVEVRTSDGVEHHLSYGEGEYRWHCTEDSQYLK